VLCHAFFQAPGRLFARRPALFVFRPPDPQISGKEHKMKIKYEFADGTVSIVEVSDEIGGIIVDSRKAEHAQQEKQRYHCYSLDAIDYEGMEYADPETPESIFLREELSKELSDALATLNETQRRRLLMYAGGLSYREIARREGLSEKKSVIECIEGARKKLKKFLK